MLPMQRLRNNFHILWANKTRTVCLTENVRLEEENIFSVSDEYHLM